MYNLVVRKRTANSLDVDGGHAWPWPPFSLIRCSVRHSVLDAMELALRAFLFDHSTQGG